MRGKGETRGSVIRPPPLATSVPSLTQMPAHPQVSNISSTRGPLGGTHSHWARFASAHAGRAWRPTDPASGGPTGYVNFDIIWMGGGGHHMEPPVFARCLQRVTTVPCRRCPHRCRPGNAASRPYCQHVRRCCIQTFGAAVSKTLGPTHFTHDSPCMTHPPQAKDRGNRRCAAVRPQPPRRCTATFGIVLDHFPRGSQLHATARRMMRSTWCPCLPDADRCLPSTPLGFDSASSGLPGRHRGQHPRGAAT